MSTDFEFFGAGDKPALLAVCSPTMAELCRLAMEAAGFRVQAVSSHQQFVDLYTRTPYQLVLLEEGFGALRPEEDPTLHYIQWLPMPQRRTVVFILLGRGHETLDPMMAFQQSVQAVVNVAQVDMLERIIRKVIADSNTFLHPFLAAQERVVKSE
jgi:hypothetical protein